MQARTEIRQYLNPVVFSLPDDGNPNCAGIEFLSVLIEEDNTAFGTHIVAQDHECAAEEENVIRTSIGLITTVYVFRCQSFVV